MIAAKRRQRRGRVDHPGTGRHKNKVCVEENYATHGRPRWI
jgi:hypothetical protein